MRFNRLIVSNDLTNRGFYITDDALVRLANSYNERNYPVFYSHNTSDIRQYVAYSVKGSAKVVGTDNGKGISIDFETLDTPEAKLLEKLLQDENAPMGFSVGISVHDYDFDESSGLIILKDVSAIEFSATPVPTDETTFDIVSSDSLVASFAKWDRAYINSLPNSSFAVIEKDYLSGKIKDKRARHLPYKDKDGKIDLPHLRNALARMNQIVPVGDSETAEELRNRARKVLIPLAKKYLPNSKWAKEEMAMEEKKFDNTSEEKPTPEEKPNLEASKDTDVSEASSNDKKTEDTKDFSSELAEFKKEIIALVTELKKEVLELKESKSKAFTRVTASASDKKEKKLDWSEVFKKVK